LIPRDSSPWNPHASYHGDGTYHHKSHDMKLGAPRSVNHCSTSGVRSTWARSSVMEWAPQSVTPQCLPRC
jgi:hypothetical protein